MKITFVGDTHGDGNFVTTAHRMAESANSDCVFQVGDFGYWEHTYSGKHFLESCALDYENFERPLFWIDGNHENHPLLWEKYDNSRLRDFEFGEIFCAEIRPGVFYVPRGTSWTWGEKKFLAMGGAYSIDKPSRVEGISWWATEMITDLDMNIAKLVNKIDVLICHDAPTFVDLEHILGKAYHPATRANREKLSMICFKSEPTLVIHGHYHDWKVSLYTQPIQSTIGGELDWKTTRVVGLAHNYAPIHQSVWSYDTEWKY